MKAQRVIKNNQKGFTLLEVIVTIIIAGILGALFIQFMGTSMIKSAEPVLMVQDQFKLYAVIENMTADYKKLFFEDLTPLETFTGKAGAENTDQNNSYGQYHVVTNHRISFDASHNERSDSSGKVQKITISYKGYPLTALYAK